MVLGTAHNYSYSYMGGRESNLRVLIKKGDEMKIKDKMSLSDLYFGVTMPQTSWNSRAARGNLMTYNVFDVSGVKWGVAKWVTMSDEERAKINNPLFFIFNDVWSRAQYEFIICPWLSDEEGKISDNGMKVDIYEMYIKPNKDLLMSLISRVSKTSAQTFLTEWRKARKGRL